MSLTPQMEIAIRRFRESEIVAWKCDYCAMLGHAEKQAGMPENWVDRCGVIYCGDCAEKGGKP